MQEKYKNGNKEIEDENDVVPQPQINHKMGLQNVESLLEYPEGQDKTPDKLVLRSLQSQVKPSMFTENVLWYFLNFAVY